MGWEVRERFKREGTYEYFWLIHADIWQKSNYPPLKIKGKKKKKKKRNKKITTKKKIYKYFRINRKKWYYIITNHF